MDDGGSNVIVQSTEANGKVLKPVDPLRSGYKFVGWYTEDDKLFDFNIVLTSDIRLLVKWEQK